MPTNYQNLDWFEASTVAMIVVGLVLFSALVIGSMGAPAKKQLANVTLMFDLHEEFIQTAEVTKFIAFDTMQEFLDQFYVEFTKVATITPEQLPKVSLIPKIAKLTLEKVKPYLEGGGGQVAGAYTEIPEEDFKKFEISLPKVEEIKIQIYNL